MDARTVKATGVAVASIDAGEAYGSPHWSADKNIFVDIASGRLPEIPVWLNSDTRAVQPAAMD